MKRWWATEDTDQAEGWGKKRGKTTRRRRKRMDRTPPLQSLGSDTPRKIPEPHAATFWPERDPGPSAPQAEMSLGEA
eukprot:2833884-Pyramimonas_sp.AAC.1